MDVGVLPLPPALINMTATDGYGCDQIPTHRGLDIHISSDLGPMLQSLLLPGVLTMLTWVLWWLYYDSFSSNDSRLPLPPGSMGLPFIGETLALCLSGASFFSERCKVYGQVYKTHILGRPTVRVVGAHNIRKVILGENTLVTSFWPASVRLVLGTQNISMSTGERHHYLRKKASRLFSHHSLSSYAPLMQTSVRDHIGRWCKDQVIKGMEENRLLTFSVACRVLLGLHDVSHSEMKGLLKVFETLIDSLFSLPVNVPGLGLSKGLWARKVLMEKIEELIRAKEKMVAEMTPSQPDALFLMMQLSKEERLSHQDLKELCLEFLFAGHVSLASTSTSLLYFLARNPRVVGRILEELEDYGLREKQADDDLTFETLGKLTYVGHVVKEVLRLMPPIGAGFRKALKTFELDGYQIPEGWAVSYSIRETQAFSDLFPDAGQFRPERWEEPIPPSAEKFNFLPFGRGPRACLGKEYANLLLKIMIVELTRSCQWQLLNEDVQFKSLPAPYPVDGLPLKVVPRVADARTPRSHAVTG